MDRMALYEQGLQDQEIASLTGSTLTAIREWRYRHGYKNNRVFKPKVERKPQRISFRKVLPPDRHDDILRFLCIVDHYKPQVLWD